MKKLNVVSFNMEKANHQVTSLAMDLGYEVEVEKDNSITILQRVDLDAQAKKAIDNMLEEEVKKYAIRAYRTWILADAIRKDMRVKLGLEEPAKAKLVSPEDVVARAEKDPVYKAELLKLLQSQLIGGDADELIISKE